jgi:2-dehydropantoate 2-reductase
MAEDLSTIKIGVLGPGGVGSLLAALLCKSGFDVSCLGSQRAADSILDIGIRVQSSFFGDFVAYPKCNPSTYSPLDVIFIAVKAPALVGSLEQMARYIGPNTVIVTLLNGIGHREKIRQTLGCRVAVGVIGSVEVYLDEDRAVLHKSKVAPHIEIASDVDVESEYLSTISVILKQCDFSVLIRENENQVIWNKLVRLAAIATLTSYSQKDVGSIRSGGRLRKLLDGVVQELCLIAKTQDVKLSAKDVMHQIDNLPESLTTSLQRDIRAGKVSEIDSILGESLRLGRVYGIAAPSIEYCYLSILAEINSRSI